MTFPASGLFVATFVDVLDTTQLALDLDLETHRVALFTDSVASPTMTTNVGYGAAPWTSNEIPNATGYTTGGELLTTTSWAHNATGVVRWTAANTPWTSATFSGARGALIYADALASNNGIAVVNFGGDYGVTSGTFTIQWSASGIFSIDFLPNES